LERQIIVIAGPTCSGKSDLAIMLAERLRSEIISADSRQIYKRLNIGTAKPSADDQKKIKHHLIDLLEPGDYYNASMFENDALKIAHTLFEKNKIPIAAGGSGLYIKALVDGIFDSAETDIEIREKYLKILTEKGKEYLHSELKKVDPASAEKIHPSFWKRVMRALEVYYSTGKPIWQHHQEQTRATDISFKQYGINWPREMLYENIEIRVEKMIAAGLLQEVKGLFDDGYDERINALNTVGYKEIFSYLRNEITLSRAVELIKRNTRRYAKRQLTWFRADDRIIWFDLKSQKDLKKIAEEIIRGEDLNERKN
jgi:tRNA dimethylallyltransferase